MARTTKDGEVFVGDVHIGTVKKDDDLGQWAAECSFCAGTDAGDVRLASTKSIAVDELEEHFNHDHVATSI